MAHRVKHMRYSKSYMNSSSRKWLLFPSDASRTLRENLRARPGDQGAGLEARGREKLVLWWLWLQLRGRAGRSMSCVWSLLAAPARRAGRAGLAMPGWPCHAGRATLCGTGTRAGLGSPPERLRAPLSPPERHRSMIKVPAAYNYQLDKFTSSPLIIIISSRSVSRQEFNKNINNGRTVTEN